MTDILSIAAGGALGALARYWLAGAVHGLLGRGFPYGTLVVNVLGSAAMGFLYVALLERTDLGPAWRGALLVGFLGAFTTFSSFSLETLALLENGMRLRAVGNVTASVALCLIACWVGLVIARRL